MAGWKRSLWRSTLVLAGSILLLVASVTVVQAVPQPAVSLNVPPDPMLNAPFTFTATFSNVGTTAGYAPFVDLVFPATGGVTFTSASYLGTPVSADVLTFPASGCVNHPFLVDTLSTPLQVCGPPGQQLVVLSLPFGSYAPSQPPVVVDVTAQISATAVPGITLNIYGRGGFRLGGDALNNPCCDPPVISNSGPNSATWPGSPFSPVIIRSEKLYLGPGDEADPAFLVPPEPAETVTGPNAVEANLRYAIAMDVASAQTVTTIAVNDYLPGNLALSSIITGPGATTPGFVLTGNPNVPGETITATWPTITGDGLPCDTMTLANCDVVLVLAVYAPYLDSVGTPTLNPATGAFAYLDNTSDSTGTWITPDPTDADQAVATGGSMAPRVVARSLALQKTVQPIGAAIPGGVLEYTLNFQVSDYFAFDQVSIDDQMFDGQTFDATFTPVFTLTRTLGGVPAVLQNGPMTNFTVTGPAADGSTALVFDISAEIGGAGQLVGGCVDGGTLIADPACGVNTGLLSGTITFRTVISEDYIAAFNPPGGSGDPSVDQGDILRNEAVMTGRLLDNGAGPPSGITVTDNSLRTVEIERGVVGKSIYAVNGATCGACTGLSLAVGDTVTYRITYSTATSDFEDLVLRDFLPAPVFNVNDPDADGVPGPVWNMVLTPSAVAPPAGTAQLGPTDTFTALSPGLPTLTTPGDNSLSFFYGDYDGGNTQASVMDILFTATITADPFAAGLTLANQVSAIEGSTVAGGDQAEAVASLSVFQPALAVRKGVIGADNPDAQITGSIGPVPFTPPGAPGTRWTGTISSNGLALNDVNGDVGGLDAGDVVSFAIIIENIGQNARGAFDIRIRDILPAGFTVPPTGINLTVTRGDGTIINFTAIGGGLFDPSGGIELIDPTPAQGACAAFDPTNGQNIVVITYDLQVESFVGAPSLLQNTTSVTQYSSADGFGTTANFVDAREGGAYTADASSVVGFFTGESGEATMTLKVAELAATGESPWGPWRPVLFLLMGVSVLLLVFALVDSLRMVVERDSSG